MWSTALPALLALGVLTIGCGDDTSMERSCWPVDTAAAGGSVTLGTGSDTFEPLPDELPLAYGGQDGFNLVVNLEQTGFGTGDPQNVLDPTNPRTRIRAYFADSDVPLTTSGECPFRVAYRDAGNGVYVLLDTLPVIFDTCWRSGNLIGKQIRLEAELLDSEGSMYAHDSRIVTATAPPTEYPDEPNAVGCQ